jgi:hypothetical protein
MEYAQPEQIQLELAREAGGSSAYWCKLLKSSMLRIGMLW